MFVRGYKRFYKRRQLEASTFLKDDCLKINCTVGVLVSSIDSTKLNPIQVPESDLGADFAILLENEQFSDVTFTVSGERFHANKLVLVARSTVFQTEFFKGMEKDDRGDIVVNDMEPKVFKVTHSLNMPIFSLSFCSYFLFHSAYVLNNSVSVCLSFAWLSNVSCVLLLRRLCFIIFIGTLL